MLTKVDAEAALRRAGVWPYMVKLVGIRGYYSEMGVPGENDLGIYDDCIMRFITNEGGGFKCDIFQASTDPGRYYCKCPLTPKGCAKLRPGLWWFTLGLHKEHPALVQDGDFDVDRLDEFGVPDWHESGEFAINLHSGGSEEDVGKFSAGCQIIFDSSGPWGETWHKFYDPIEREMKKHKQRQIPYILLEV